MPNVEGKFIVTVVNTGSNPVRLRKRHILGHLVKPDEIIASVDFSENMDQTNFMENEIGARLAKQI